MVGLRLKLFMETDESLVRSSLSIVNFAKEVVSLIETNPLFTFEK